MIDQPITAVGDRIIIASGEFGVATTIDPGCEVPRRLQGLPTGPIEPADYTCISHNSQLPEPQTCLVDHANSRIVIYSDNLFASEPRVLAFSHRGFSPRSLAFRGEYAYVVVWDGDFGESLVRLKTPFSSGARAVLERECTSTNSSVLGATHVWGAHGQILVHDRILNFVHRLDTNCAIGASGEVPMGIVLGVGEADEGVFGITWTGEQCEFYAMEWEALRFRKIWSAGKSWGALLGIAVTTSRRLVVLTDEYRLHWTSVDKCAWRDADLTWTSLASDAMIDRASKSNLD